MKNKPLVDLLHDLEQEMLRLGYTDGSMLFYRGRWKKLLKFSKEKKQVFYSEQLGLGFLEKYFHIFEKDFDRTLSQSETQEIRVIGHSSRSLQKIPTSYGRIIDLNHMISL